MTRQGPQAADACAELTQRRRLAHGLFAGALAVCAMLVLYPPSRVGFYPACPVREYLRLECPGCGATRALAALLRGHLIDALRLNALFTTLLPVALAGAIESYGRALRPGVFRWPQIPDSALFTALGATGVFTILRNLPL